MMILVNSVYLGWGKFQWAQRRSFQKAANPKSYAIYWVT